MWEPQGMYSKFLLKQPTILFGDNAIMGLKTYATSRVSVIYGSGLDEDYKDKISNALSAFEISFVKKTWIGEPTLKTLHATIKKIEEFNPDLIIAVGGGSVIDGAKMVRTYYEFPFFNINETSFSMLNWKTTFVAIPTTIGSGAEISSASVMYNDSHRTKEFVVSHQFIPEIIVLDASLIVNAPKNMLLASMVDALSHAIEGYMSNIDNMLVDSYAEKAIQIISQFHQVISEGTSPENINKLQLASLFAGLVQNHCIVGATHALAHQMSAYGLSHSAAIAIFLPAVIRKNNNDQASKERFGQLAKHSGFNNGEDLLTFVEDFIAGVDLTKERKIVKENEQHILSDNDFFIQALDDKGGQGNPVPMDKGFLLEIFKEACS
ncbi:iron-containing alcohol dehydrogenase [Maribacter sp. PR1]|uniref:Iron-containing alcohol dehydrogenase n=1 Tax=Maribacter cobaltidurans TaxID=1178778 RepID=A0ABU7IWG7_9FLAO|nr:MULTISPECIES: iron-containing alcohol dehydrogenase [Maribacter]MDC6389783.1 iron-containing alcohol dehydrogenase [Maribacter sp. PR1]MEE1977173.1 iron-containing alcohol dehydrogenase [Maribacter cobaltidurans]